VDEMYCNGVPREELNRLENTLKSRKIRLVHLGYRKIFKGFGQPVNQPCFIADGGFIGMVLTVDDGLFCVLPVYSPFGTRVSWKELI
jgi:hypothetical protein